MKAGDLATALNMKLIGPGGGREVTSGYTSDLLSDVMANAAEGCALITIQAHVNTVAVSALTGVAAVIICNGIDIPGDMAAAAEREGIAILQTEHDQFKTSYLVYCKIAGGAGAG
jgi:predicted transcriptional regulator